MVGDSTLSRRRQSSAASGTRTAALQARQAASKSAAQAKSAHVADPYLQAFLDPAFDPAEFLNKTLPALQPSSSARGALGAVPLAELSSQAQTTLSHLNAHTTRLTNTLTQLTDDILRSGSRLAYEVELLRGETLSLAEALTEGLQDDISKFVPGGIKEGSSAVNIEPSSPIRQRRASSSVPPTPAGVETASSAAAAASTSAVAPNEPSYITQLRTLTLVRARLDSVIKTFGEAMEFVFPPSELSVSSSFLSVSAPDAGGQNHSTEDKGQQVLQKLRDEISAMLHGEDPVKGIEDAARRIEELKELNRVWKGTAEEKGRTKFIDALAKMVEDRHRELLREMEQSSKKGDGKAEAVETAAKKASGESDVLVTESKGYTGYNLISQLQKLRSGL